MKPPENAETIGSIMHAIAEIGACQDDFAVNALLQRILPPLGGESYIYSTFLGDDCSERRESYRWLIGCNPVLCQLYNEKKWYMNDANIEYGKSHSEVIASADIPRNSLGQKESLQAAQKYGFLSSVIAPAHSGSSDRVGLLYVGSSAVTAAGNARLLSHRIILRSIAMEILDWWVTRLRARSREKFELSDKEIIVMKMLKSGYRAGDAGAELGISAKAINIRVKTLKSKFRVDSIKDVLKVATLYGLLD